MKRLFAIVALLSALTLVAAACGGTKDTGFPGPDETPTTEPSGTKTDGGAGGATVQVADSMFEPKTITVKVGDKVVWEQTGQAPHNVKADDGSFDSNPDCSASNSGQCMGSGDTFERAFDTAGTIKYHCVIHGGPGGAGMAGEVVVEA